LARSCWRAPRCMTSRFLIDFNVGTRPARILNY
jgi:hypothetical protein